MTSMDDLQGRSVYFQQADTSKKHLSTDEWIHQAGSQYERWQHNGGPKYEDLMDCDEEIPMVKLVRHDAEDVKTDEGPSEVVALDEGVTVTLGQAHFNNTGTTVIEESDAATQQRIFDRLPLSQTGRKVFYDWLVEDYNGRRQWAQETEQHADKAIAAAEAKRRPEDDLRCESSGGPGSVENQSAEHGTE